MTTQQRNTSKEELVCSQPSFVHLHVHTQYSLLEGAIRTADLIKKVVSNKMPAVAITDANNIFGAVDFFTSAVKAGVKPIIGCEVFYGEIQEDLLASNKKKPKSVSSKHQPTNFHLVLLCKNQKGYLNLCKILTRAYMDADGTNHIAQVTPDLLKKHKEGLIVLSGCLRGPLSYEILKGEEKKAHDEIAWFKKEFGDDFYLELQDMGLPEQDQVNEVLFHLGKKEKIKVVATSDCHYLETKDAEAHEILQCIGKGRKLDFERPRSLAPAQYNFCSAEEMLAKFEKYPGACEATLEIADKCNFEFKFKDENGKPIFHLPDFKPADHDPKKIFDLPAFFRKESKLGLDKRFLAEAFNGKDRKEYDERLSYELDMILKTGFAGYFLIVADYVGWAKKNGIPVGPGRGSGAGSLVAYALDIVDIDPIECDLLFERFINPERISMPDFDVDFCQERRGEVIDYVGNRYGKESVCQIITFGKLQPRAVVKDVGRVLGLPFSETDQVTKLFPKELNITLTDALEKEPKINEVIQANPRLAKVFEYALTLEGLYRNAGIHAAGVIITDKPTVEYCPLYVGADGDVVSMFNMEFAEKIGLIKFDFLGLKTLTVVDYAVKLVRIKENPEFDITKLDYKNPKVFELISSGDTDGIFQVESSGMKDLCSRLQPSNMGDLTAINGLYRPGPLGSGLVDEFIDRKHGRKPIVYELELLEPILKDTYGIIVYQEQVMRIARELAGYSLGQADMLRRAMGKKKKEEMDRHRGIFLEGAKEKDIPKEKAEKIFDQMAKFAEYGFNKSHSAAYVMITYQTAFLKVFYPAEFMAALMTTEMSNTDKLAKYLGDARAHHIAVLPPDVNRSIGVFGVEEHLGKKAIRFGLEAIKGVGGIAVETMIEERKNGDFKSLVDFCQRVSTRKVNKKVLEALTLSGAFDSISEINRPSVIASIESLLKMAADDQEERALGQSSLFDGFNAEEIKLVTPSDSVFKEVPDFSQSEKLKHEKQAVGFYVSGHPMDAWQSICEDWLGWNTQKVKEKAPKPVEQAMGGGSYMRMIRKKVELGGLFTDKKEIMTKKGDRMAFATFEDLKGSIEVIFFPEAYSKLQSALDQCLAETEPVVLTAEVDSKEETVKLFASQVRWAKDAHQGAKRVILNLQPSKITVDQLRNLKASMIEHPGKCKVRLVFCDKKFSVEQELPETLNLSGTPQMVAAINRIFGQDVVVLR